jgi:hypothetical protein
VYIWIENIFNIFLSNQTKFIVSYCKVFREIVMHVCSFSFEIPDNQVLAMGPKNVWRPYRTRIHHFSLESSLNIQMTRKVFLYRVTYKPLDPNFGRFLERMKEDILKTQKNVHNYTYIVIVQIDNAFHSFRSLSLTPNLTRLTQRKRVFRKIIK